MYDDRKEKFSFKNFFLTILIVLLFVFLMLWLFPTKGYVDGKLDNYPVYDLDRLSVLYDEIFANNVARMKDAAIGYFTNERLPQKIGESKKLTLQEMYDLHLVLRMKGKDSKECDVTRSYVEITKYTEEYRLKVNLSCGGQEDYIIVYLGCYNYCPDGICEKNVPVPSDKTKEEEKNPTPEPVKYYCKVVDGKYYDKSGNVVSKAAYEKDCITQPEPVKYYCKVVDGKYYDKSGNIVSKAAYEKDCITKPTVTWYEYKLDRGYTTSCTNWSNWQKNPVTATNNVKVETSVRNEIVGYKTVQVQKGTKTETTIKKVPEPYISSYTTELKVVGTKQVQVGETTKEVTSKVQVGVVEKYKGVGSGPSVPQSTSTLIYKNVTVSKPPSCSYCESKTIYHWEVYGLEPVYDMVKQTVKIPVMKTVNIYEETKVPVYSYRDKEVKETKEVPNYVDEKVPQYGNVTYYRYQTCNTSKLPDDYQWSRNSSDSYLIGKGYRFTGNVKQI